MPLESGLQKASCVTGLDVCALLFCACPQRVVRVKKTDEAEEEGSVLTEDEIELLSQGLCTLTLRLLRTSIL